jgi:hypothetical protein
MSGLFGAGQATLIVGLVAVAFLCGAACGALVTYLCDHVHCDHCHHVEEESSCQAPHSRSRWGVSLSMTLRLLRIRRR